MSPSKLMITPLNIIKKRVVFLLLLLVLTPCLVSAEKPVNGDALEGAGLEEGSAKETRVGPSLADLVVKAADAVKFKDDRLAGDLYRKINRDFPDTPEAVSALWSFAELQKKLAVDSKVEWEFARDAYKNFISFYPGSENAARAYFEVAKAHYFMSYQREALSYFKLCIKRFPDNELAGEAEYWQLRILIEIGRIADAKRKIEELADHEIAKVRLRAKVRLAEIHNLNKDFYSSLNIYHELASIKPDFYLDAPEALRIFGQANLLAGNSKKGRDQLIYYLNLAEDLTNRADIFFYLGESYWQEKKYLVARKMFERAIEKGVQGRQAVVFSQMRIAQYQDDPLRPPGKWEKKRDLNDPEGDKPYLKVLDLFYDDPIAQDARASLFMRFTARDDLDSMRDYGKNFLRSARLTKIGPEEKKKAGQILLALAEKMHKEKKYQELYELYFSEHEHVKDFPNGRFLYLVGKAMESLAMYDQAAVIYYRALKWPLSEEDKIDLYYRRANVYLSQGATDSAERLLKHLRKIYKGKKEIGEIMWYSGQLRESQKRAADSLKYYREAAEVMTFPSKKAEYVSSVLRLVLELNSGKEALAEINSYKEKGVLVGADLQQWYARAGDTLRLQGHNSEAIEAYKSALADNLPQEGKSVQSAQLYIGDCYVAEGDEESGIANYKLAASGADEMLKQMAQERLNQKDIEHELSKIEDGK
jgi:hypothetical protein